MSALLIKALGPLLADVHGIEPHLASSLNELEAGCLQKELRKQDELEVNPQSFNPS